jgi:hypothetical protein
VPAALFDEQLDHRQATAQARRSGGGRPLEEIESPVALGRPQPGAGVRQPLPARRRMSGPFAPRVKPGHRSRQGAEEVRRPFWTI